MALAGASATLVRSGDAETINALYRAQRIDWVQMERGPFQGSLSVVDLGSMRVSREEFNLGWRRNGELRPDHLLVGLTLHPATRVRWFGSKVGSNDLCVTGNTLDVGAESFGSGFAVMIDAACMRERFGSVAGIGELLDNCQRAHLQTSPAYAPRLRSFMRGLFTMLDIAPATVMRPIVAAVLERDLVPLLAGALGGAPGGAHHHHNRRVAAVRACERFMQEHVDAPITLYDLSQVTGMQPRSVANAFEAVTGLTPMAYLRARRLSGVRRALQRPEGGNVRIIDVAADWGFWHMGHFTAAYQSMFGETPSETLRRWRIQN